VVNYKEIIEQYHNKGIKASEIRRIFASLREAGATRQDLTKDLHESILNLFKGNRTEEEQAYYNSFLLDIIVFCSTFILNSAPEKEKTSQPESKQVEEGCETPPEDVLSVKPEDFKKPEYDHELLKEMGWENPDG